MADISAEIAAFKNAVYGEDVRDAMVSLANKINTESSAAHSDIDNCFRYRGTLTSSDDANNLNSNNQVGTYRVKTSEGYPANIPIQTSGMLIVFYNAYTCQMFINSTDIYFRFYASTSGWYNWIELGSKNDIDTNINKCFMYRSTLTSSDNANNLNSISDTGTYRIKESEGYPANIPAEVSGILLVFYSYNCLQVYVNSNDIYFRFYAPTGGWLNWYKLALENDIVTINATINSLEAYINNLSTYRQILTSSDNINNLNTISDTGTYRIKESEGYPVNLPIDSIGTLIVNYSYNCFQIFINDTDVYFRFYTPTRNWFEWNKIAKVSDLYDSCFDEYTFTFVTGGMGGNGVITVSTPELYKRSLDFIKCPANSIIIAKPSLLFPNGYSLVIYAYSDPDFNSYTGRIAQNGPSSSENNIEIPINENRYLRIRLADINGNTIDNIDSSLIDFVKLKVLNNVKNYYDEFRTITDRLTWTLGDLNKGISYSSNTNIITPFYKVSKGDILTAEVDPTFYYKASFYFYNIPSEEYWSFDDSWSYDKTSGKLNTLEHCFDKDGYIRIRMNKYDNSNLTNFDTSTVWWIKLIRNNNIKLNFDEFIDTKTYNFIDVIDREYKLPSEWLNRIDAIQKEQGTKIAFAVQSDTHFSLYGHEKYDRTAYWERNNKDYITPLKNVANLYNFDFICNLGDLIRGYECDTYSEAQEAMREARYRYVENCPCPVLFTIGNHDTNPLWTTSEIYGGHNTIDEIIRPPELYSKLIKATKNSCRYPIRFGTTKMYYHISMDEIDVIVLNTNDYPCNEISENDVNIHNHIISQDQIDWFTETLTNHITKPLLILSHVPIKYFGSGRLPTNADIMCDIIETYGQSNRVIGVLSGHIHAQNSMKVNNINYITFAKSGTFAEIVIVDIINRTIITRIIGDYGDQSLNDRSFTF